MLSLFDRPGRNKPTRRELLQIGSLGMAGLALPHLRRTALERRLPRDNMFYGEIRQRVVSPLDRELP